MRLVLSFGFNDTWLILIRCSFSVITSVITVWHMVSFTVGTLKTTHSATVRFSFVSRQWWSSQLGSCCVVVCGFHTDVKESEWLSAQMRSQASLLKSQCVSGYQTEVWTHWRSFYLLRQRTQDTAEWVMLSNLSLALPVFLFCLFSVYAAFWNSFHIWCTCWQIMAWIGKGFIFELFKVKFGWAAFCVCRPFQEELR